VDQADREPKGGVSRDVIAGGIGGSAGAGFGLLVGGPAGAVGGAIVGTVTTGAATKVIEWIRGRQAQRVKTLVERIDARISERIALGEQPRDDGFLGDSGANLAEAAIATAQREYDLKKVDIYAELVASIAFDPEIDSATAHFCIRTAERLSYRQLCALAAFGRHLGVDLMKHDYAGQTGTESRPASVWVVDVPSEGVMLEVFEMVQLGLVTRKDKVAVTSWPRVAPALMKPTGLGSELVRLGLMKLDKVEVEATISGLLADAFDSDEELSQQGRAEATGL
jgi:hypothetical protein